MSDENSKLVWERISRKDTPCLSGVEHFTGVGCEEIAEAILIGQYMQRVEINSPAAKRWRGFVRGRRLNVKRRRRQ